MKRITAFGITKTSITKASVVAILFGAALLAGCSATPTANAMLGATAREMRAAPPAAAAVDMRRAKFARCAALYDEVSVSCTLAAVQLAPAGQEVDAANACIESRLSIAGCL